MAHIQDIGIAIGKFSGLDLLAQLEQGLAYMANLGFRLVEIDVAAFGLIINGKLHHARLNDFAAVLKNFALRYSVHGLMRLNLAYDPRHNLCREIMQCQIEICRVIGASTLVYHSGLQALDDARHGVRRSLLSDEELFTGAQQEVAAFKALGPIATDAGVTIGMENGDPHQWEYNVLAQYNYPATALTKHHARLKIAPIVQQLQAINHPNIGMTLDVGHLYLASRLLDFDFINAVEEAAPWVRHIHAHDNFGNLDRGFGSAPDRWPYGEADMHMPPGWGTIPLREFFNSLPDYDRDVVLEIKPGFFDYFAEALATTQDLLDR